MERTMSSTDQVILQEEKVFAWFRHTLKPADQPLLDELLYDLKLATIQVLESGRTPRFEGMLLVMLLVHYRELKWLWRKVDELERSDKLNVLLRREAQLSRSRPVDPGFGFGDDPRS